MFTLLHVQNVSFKVRPFEKNKGMLANGYRRGAGSMRSNRYRRGAGSMRSNGYRRGAGSMRSKKYHYITIKDIHIYCCLTCPFWSRLLFVSFIL